MTVMSSTIEHMYEEYFLSYASYVILERAIPSLEDGFKPVQRRILHAMKETDDGRFNKIANVIGNTMQYHPHGDASIGEAIINLGQKDLLIETQGNWGDTNTGDSAAAPRYIEGRLSKFALDIAFNPKITAWQDSYDGRKKEPIHLPVKFPLLLAQGAEGIAVGLLTKVMPHNFCELIRASIQLIKGKKVKLVPDFPSGGYMDASDYKEGQKGGKIRLRADIRIEDNKTLRIKQVPYSTTTQSIIDSVLKANDSGKVKIKKIIDNTAEEVDIEIQLNPGQSPDMTLAALYAFTDCEISISPITCVIVNKKPAFLSVHQLLQQSLEHTIHLLKQELEIQAHELQEKLLALSLEKIFIEERIYRQIEECETWEEVLETIRTAFEAYKDTFYRSLTQEDITRLTEIKIKRISKYDSEKNNLQIQACEGDLEQVQHDLNNLNEYAISYFTKLLEKYGKGKERKTTIQSFDVIQRTQVVQNNTKLYVNKKDGFIGHGIKKDEFVQACSDIDDIIVFKRHGECSVHRIGEKVYVGKNIMHVEVFVKDDERRTYNLIYIDSKTGISYAKRFRMGGVTKDKVYNLTGDKNNKVMYFSSNANGEAELLQCSLSANCRAKIKVFDYNLAELQIKGRASKGNIVSKYPIRKIKLKKEGFSTLPDVDIWYEDATGTLNQNEIGTYVGSFSTKDQMLIVYKTGEYELIAFDMKRRFDIKKVYSVAKLKEDLFIATVYIDGTSGSTYVKRFEIDVSTLNKTFSFIGDDEKNKLIWAGFSSAEKLKLSARGESIEINLSEIEINKNRKSIGKLACRKKVTKAQQVID